jgi:putative intracellular protease/amidase
MMDAMLETEILAFDGFDELDVVAPLEILKSAGFEVRLVTSAPCDIVHGAYGLRVRPDLVLDELREYGADVRPDARVVDDGDVITSGGVTSGIDLALHLVDRELGKDAAAAAAARIEYDVRGAVLDTSQR